MSCVYFACYRTSLLVATIALCAQRSDAQVKAASPHSRAVACVDTVSLRPSNQMLVYLTGTVADSADPAFADMGDQFTQSISQHVRALLHASGPAIPRGEPRITWRAVASHAGLRVTVHREAAPQFTLVDSSNASPIDTLLLRAATDAQAAGDGVYWPGSTQGDSATYIIRVELPSFGQMYPAQALRVVFPTFSVLFPRATPAVLTSTSAPADPFPGSAVRSPVVVVTQFDVDSTGRVIPSSITEVAPPGVERTAGSALDTYIAYVKSVLNWLPTATFSPARVGGCPIRQTMRLPITFGVAR